LAGYFMNSEAVPRIRFSAVQAAAMGYVTIEETGEGYLPVYFSGTTDPAVATRLDLQPGANVTGIDLTVVEARAVRVRGRLTSILTGQPVPGTSVFLQSRAEGVAMRSVTVTQTGNFEFRGVVPGRYNLISTIGGDEVIITPDGGFGFRPNNNPNVQRFAASQTIEVEADDLEDIALVLEPGYDIGGRIAIEGQPLADNDALWARTQVVLDSEERLPGLLSVRAPIAPDGTFTLKGVMRGAYRLRTENSPPNTYRKFARLGNAEALVALINIDGEPRGMLDITLGTNPASVDIRVSGDPQTPVGGVTVVLVPDAPRRASAYMYEQGEADADGNVRFEGVVPGEYKIFVWESVPRDAWMDAEFLSTYESLGTTVRIDEGGKHKFEATILPAR
jgi:hypothetical protein